MPQLPSLTPKSGGRSLLPNGLNTADLLVSRVVSAKSSAIRFATGEGEVSHIAIFVGSDPRTGGKLAVIEAVGTGVRIVTIDEFLADNSLVVAFRKPRIETYRQNYVHDFAVSKIGAKYDFWGAASQVRFTFHGKTYSLIDLGLSRSKFYCSSLVTESYQAAGIPLLKTAARWNSPNDLVTLTWVDDLEYVGHLKY